MARTQAEVDALWCGRDSYTLASLLQFNDPPELGITLEAAAARLQELYDNPAPIAGRFQVRAGWFPYGGYTKVYAVDFIRDICDDADIVESRLLAGDTFSTTLEQQFLVEFNESLAARELELSLRLLSVTFMPFDTII